jgi:hemerythrin
MMRQEELPMVAMAAMNDTHLEEMILINKISEAVEQKDEEKVTVLLDALLEHTIEHFSGEEKMMCQKRFPPYPMHKGEHDQALAELRIVVALWKEQHDFASLARYIGETLPQWIVQHIRTMDTATANFLAGGASPCSSGRC